MPTVIDALIVKLGLDSKDLDQKAPGAGKVIDGIDGRGKETTKTVKGLGQALSSMLAIIGGTVAIKRFVEDFISANAELDRFSKNIGLSVSTISAWGNAVEGLGGNAKSAQGTLDMLSKAQTELRLTGESSLIPYFSALGVSLATVEGQAKPVDQILLDLSERFGKMDRTTANNMGRMMGIDQDTMNLLLQGRQEVELTIKRQKEYGAVTKAQAEEASKLQRSIVSLKQQFGAFGRELVMAAAPALEKLLELLTGVGRWVTSNSEFVKDFLTVMAVGFGAVALAALPLTGTIAIITGLSGAIALLWQDYQTWKRGGDSLIDWAKWETGIKLAGEGVEWLAHKLGASFDAIRAGAKMVKEVLNGNWKAADEANEEFREKTGALLGIKPLGATPKAAASALVQKIEQSSPGQALSAAVGRGSETVEHTIARLEGFYAAADAKGRSLHAPNRPQRNHNPGDIEYGPFARKHGATGTDGRFAIFPDDATGEKALHDLLRTSGYKNLTVAQAVAKFAPPKENDTAGYTRSLSSRTGLDINANLGAALAAEDGVGTALRNAAVGPTARNAPASQIDRSIESHVGQIVVYTSATDANGIARDMGKSMDYLFASQANTGLD